jgi:hypothetical protein
MSETNWPALTATIERLKELLATDPQNLERFLANQRHSAIGAMVRNIAHTFNNVLGGILGYSQLLKDEVEEGSHAHRHALIIEGAAKRAANLVSQIYVMSNHSHSQERRVIDPKLLIEEVVALLKSSFPPNIAFATVFNHHDRRVLVDYPNLCQVLLHICMNARDAMPEGGELTIATYLSDKSEGANLAAEVDEYVLFKITDTGAGIPAELLPHIFEPFVSTREKKVAGGLGLTLAKAIVQDHGGDIFVKSEPGKGAIVTVRIPTAPAMPAAESQPVADATSSAQSRAILVVDDEEELRDLAKSIFERKGFHVLLAENGESALNIFEDHQHDIGLVLLDVSMPGLSAEQVYRRLQESNRRVKIILTSGHARYSAHLKFLERANLPFFPKPWDLPELIKEVTRMLQIVGSR